MEKKESIKKIFKVLYNIIYTMVFIVVLLILIAVILQRVSNNTLSFGGFRIFNIVSESMIPKYEIGDVLLSKTFEPEEIQVGDDVVYIGKEGSFAGRVVTHQVIGKTEKNGIYEFETKGIANTEKDPTVYEDQIYGKVIYKINILSFISKMINNMYAFYFLIFIPIALIAAKQVKNIFDNFSEDDDDEDDEDEANK